MQQPMFNVSNEKSIGKLSIVRNFKKVIEGRNIKTMNNELYEFFNLHCGFIAHYNIDGFKSTYSRPQDFAEVFIRHFDKNHRYFNGIYPYHEEPYRDTGFTKTEVKREFFKIVDMHKEQISKWAETKQRSERFAHYLALKNEFEPESKEV